MEITRVSCERIGLAIATLAVAAGLFCAEARADDFVSAVSSTHPVAYYRLDSPTGKSQVGATQYTASGGVTPGTPGAPIGMDKNQFAKLDGHDGYIQTTQNGGIVGAGSLMAWINLASLPSAAGRIFYIAGESQNGNDFDVQIEQDNAVKFYTAAGAHATYLPDPTTLVNQWHLVVVTMDQPTQTRVIYWDGQTAATDKGGVAANKKSALSIGESTVFRGRYFAGGIEEVALWNRALKPAEVKAIYDASKSAATPARARSSAPVSASPATGPFATTAKVQVEDGKGPVALKRDEQIAIMFLTAIQQIEFDCQLRLMHACSLDVMLAGSAAPDGSHLQRLEFDPKTDPNYTYVVAASSSGLGWEAHANAKAAGLKGFYFVATGMGGPNAFYSPSGTAGIADTQLSGRSIEGDSFATQ